MVECIGCEHISGFVSRAKSAFLDKVEALGVPITVIGDMRAYVDVLIEHGVKDISLRKLKETNIYFPKRKHMIIYIPKVEDENEDLKILAYMVADAFATEWDYGVRLQGLMPHAILAPLIPPPPVLPSEVVESLVINPLARRRTYLYAEHKLDFLLDYVREVHKKYSEEFVEGLRELFFCQECREEKGSLTREEREASIAVVQAVLEYKTVTTDCAYPDICVVIDRNPEPRQQLKELLKRTFEIQFEELRKYPVLKKRIVEENGVVYLEVVASYLVKQETMPSKRHSDTGEKNGQDIIYY